VHRRNTEGADRAEAPLWLRGEARRVSGRVAARTSLRLRLAVAIVEDVLSSASTSPSSLSHGGVGLVAPAYEEENKTGDRSIWD
jgi:hypothetical protein